MKSYEVANRRERCPLAGDGDKPLHPDPNYCDCPAVILTSDNPTAVVRYTRAEWLRFLTNIDTGHFDLDGFRKRIPQRELPAAEENWAARKAGALTYAMRLLTGEGTPPFTEIAWSRSAQVLAFRDLHQADPWVCIALTGQPHRPDEGAELIEHGDSPWWYRARHLPDDAEILWHNPRITTAADPAPLSWDTAAAMPTDIWKDPA